MNPQNTQKNREKSGPLTLTLLGVVALPLDVTDVLDHLFLVELLGQHLGRLAVVVTGPQDVGGTGPLTHQELEAGQLALHRRQVRCGYED